MARLREFPYELREYRLPVPGTRLLKKVHARDTDSIQLLLHSLDVAAANR